MHRIVPSRWLALSLSLGLGLAPVWALLLALGPIQPANAAGAVVGTGTPDTCTEAAFNNAVSTAISVTFNCGPDPVIITLTSAPRPTYRLVTGRSLTVDGGGLITLQLTTTLPSMLDLRGGAVFLVEASGALTLTNLTIDRGIGFANVSGGNVQTEPLVNYGRLTLINVNLTNNIVTGGGSAVGTLYNLAGATLIANGGTWSGNSGRNGSASVLENLGAADLTGIQVIGNLNVSGSGAAAIQNTGGLTITSGLFQGNTAGCLNNASGGRAMVISTTVLNNTGPFSPGFLNTGALVISQSTFTLNTAANGTNSADGGALNNQGALTITASSFISNTAQRYGGAVYSTAAIHCHITKNFNTLPIVNITHSRWIHTC